MLASFTPQSDLVSASLLHVQSDDLLTVVTTGEPKHLDLTFVATKSCGQVSATLTRPPDAWCLYILAHGAGAGMNHPFLSSMARELAHLGMATFRYQFPSMEAQKRRPDPAPILETTVRSAVAAAAQAAPDLPLLAGGKSMGGRMTSRAGSVEPFPGVLGLVFLGFPLHPAGKPSTDRADHLQSVELPMLFLQGTRDRLADLELLQPVIASLGDRAHLHLVPDGDHSFHVLKRTDRTDDEVLQELARTIASWAEEVLRS